MPGCSAVLSCGRVLPTAEAPHRSPGCPNCAGSTALPQPKKRFSDALLRWEGWYPTDTGLSLSRLPRYRQVHGERGPVFLPVTLGHPECQRGDGGLRDRCFHRGKSLEVAWVGYPPASFPGPLHRGSRIMSPENMQICVIANVFLPNWLLVDPVPRRWLQLCCQVSPGVSDWRDMLPFTGSLGQRVCSSLGQLSRALALARPLRVGCT